MFGPRELDIRLKNFSPNLGDVVESAKRTYGSANSLFEINELNLNNLAKKLESGELSLDEDIYDKSHITVSLLAECCEMYLKALFLFENRNSGKTCNELWSILEAKMKEDNTKDDGRVRDKNGNIVYYQTVKDKDGYESPLRHSDGTIIYVYAKVDSSGNIVNDANGQPIYVDKTGKEYNYKEKGVAVRTNGHALDRLVELLSPESRLLLETRMLTIPMDITEKKGKVSILDILQNKGVLLSSKLISQDQFAGWLDQHKRSFEESRYPGQKKYDISVEFMHHLENQIKAVVQYKMDPKKDQIFTITEEQMEKMPDEIRQIVSSHPNILSEKLVKLIANDEQAKNKIITLFSEEQILLKSISASNFYNLIQMMNINEILYVIYICNIASNFYSLGLSPSKDEQTYKAIKISNIFANSKMRPNKIAEFFIQLKSLFNIPLNNDSVEMIFDLYEQEFGYNPFETPKYDFNNENEMYKNNYNYNIYKNYK